MTKNDLQFLTRFLPKKSPVPVLELAAWNTRGEVFTTDLESWALVATDDEPASDTLLNVKYALALAKSRSVFRAQGAELTVDGEIVPTPALASEEYPVWVDYGKICAYVTFQPGEFQNAIATTLLSVSTDDSRPALTGVCFDFTQPATLNVVSTDTHRVTIVPVHPKIEETGEVLNECRFIVPATVLQKLLPFLKDVKTCITVTFSERMTVVHFDHKTLATRNLAGMFPDYQRVIPKNQGTFVSFKRAEFAERLKAYISLAKLHKTSILRFTMLPGGESDPSLMSMWGSLGGSEKYMLKALETSTPMPFPIAFDAQYLLDAMNQFSASEYVVFMLNGPLRPVKITGLNSETLVVLMPMQYMD